MVEPHSLNFRVITTHVLGVQIFRKFTVLILSVAYFDRILQDFDSIVTLVTLDSFTCSMSYNPKSNCEFSFLQRDKLTKLLGYFFENL